MNPPDKNKRREIKNALKAEALRQAEKSIAERRKGIAAAGIEIKEMIIPDEDFLVVLVAELESLRNEGKVQLKKGSFNLGSFVNAEFTLKEEGRETSWVLECLNEAPMGNGRLFRK